MQSKYKAPEMRQPQIEPGEPKWRLPEVATEVMSKATQKSHELYGDYLIDIDLPWIFELKAYEPTSQPIKLGRDYFVQITQSGNKTKLTYTKIKSPNDTFVLVIEWSDKYFNVPDPSMPPGFYKKYHYCVSIKKIGDDSK